MNECNAEMFKIKDVYWSLNQFPGWLEDEDGEKL